MKTTQRGFIVPLLLIIVAILLAGGGAYLYKNSEHTLWEKGTPDSMNKDAVLSQATSTMPTTNQTSPTTQATSTRSNEFSALPTSGSAPLAVTFSFVLLDTNVSTNLYGVDFGDNSTTTGDMQETRCAGECRKFTVVHTYTTFGAYTAKLIGSVKGARYGGKYIGTTTITVASSDSQTVDLQASFTSENLSSAPLGIQLPQGCGVVSGNKAFDSALKTFAGFEWTVNCGSANNGNARATMEPILKQQGWAFCDSGLATVSWWKAGILTSINEGSADRAGVSYPFGLHQSRSTSCSGN